jgi:hypothetical protein
MPEAPRRAASTWRRPLPPLLGLLLLASGAAPAADDAAKRFPDARVKFEQNATDGDVEVVFEVTGGAAGLTALRVVAPDGRTVVDFSAPDSTKYGIRSFAFESPEPKDVAGLKAAYPEGAYRFDGRAVDGKAFQGEATLSHQLPGTAGFVQPGPGARAVPVLGLEIRWTPVAGAAGYVVEIEQEELGDALKVTLPASATRVSVPNDLLRPGTEYKLAIGAFTENGNVSFVETSFETSETD